MWKVRQLAEKRIVELPSANEVLQGLIDGRWQPDDEVLREGESLWIPIEEHPTFADAVAEMGPPPSEPPDETRLDMNPLIDVALVLLIFFILTTSYASLRRSISLPDTNPDGSSKAAVPKKQLQERAFRVSIDLDPTGRTLIRLNDKPVSLENLEEETRRTIQTTGKKEALMTVANDVPWGVEARTQDALKGAGVVKIIWPRKAK